MGEPQEVARPHDIDAERAVIGAMLIDPEAIAVASKIVRADDFYNDNYRIACRAIYAIYERGELPDLIVVNAELRQMGHTEPSVILAGTTGNVPHSGHVEKYARLVAQLAHKAAALDAWKSSLADLSRTDLPPQAMVARTLRRFQDVSERIKQADQRDQIMSLAQLMALDTPEMVWPVAGLMPEGLAIIGAPPKTGKSAIALQLALAIGYGASFLGNYTVAEQGDALYLALEDSHARLKQRIGLQLQGQDLPAGVDVALDCPPMLDGGLLLIESWLIAHPNARMVVIDTLGRFRGVGSQTENGNLFAADYDDMSRLQRLAMEHHVAIVALHHLTKNTGAKTDPLEMLSGTMGISAPADVVWVIQRERNEEKGKLHIIGRDVEEQTLAISLSPHTLTWQALGVASEIEEREGWREVWDAIRELGGEASPSEIAAVTATSRESLKMRCLRMKRAGYLESTGNRGRYRQSRPTNIENTRD